jgi:hypothetical protein
MADDTDVLLKLFEEERNQGLHLESQRAIVTNFIITISAAIVGFLVQKKFEIYTLPLAMMLILLGIYGIVISTKLYERWQIHSRRARYWRRRIDQLHPKARIEPLRVKADVDHSAKYSKIEKIRLYRLWLLLHILIALMGVICTIIIIIRAQ